MFKSIFMALFVAVTLFSSPLAAEVRFGKNVRVGGHDFSNRTFTRDRNAIIYLYDKKPANAGCRWVAHRNSKGRLTGKKRRSVICKPDRSASVDR